jgi:hypothetical protein
MQLPVAAIGFDGANQIGLSLVDQIQPLVYHFCPCGAKMIHNKDKNTMLPQANAL